MNVYDLASPNESNAERLVTEALVDSQAPEDVVRAIRPPLPQIVAFPPRYGWPSYQARQAGIEEVLDIERLYGDAREAISGGPAGYAGSMRNVQTSGNW